MQALVQRVQYARVRVNDEVVGAIEHGLLVLVCAEHGDTQVQADKLLDKLLKLRIFSDERDRMNWNVQDVRGGLLLVSQFTLVADLTGGNRPSFTAAAAPALAKQLFDYLVMKAGERHAPVASGIFAADMKVELLNDGPVTIPLRFDPSPAVAVASV